MSERKHRSRSHTVCVRTQLCTRSHLIHVCTHAGIDTCTHAREHAHTRACTHKIHGRILTCKHVPSRPNGCRSSPFHTRTAAPAAKGALLGDLHRYEPKTRQWTDLSAATGSPPSPRGYYGMSFAADGALYLFAGMDSTGARTALVSLNDRFGHFLAVVCLLMRVLDHFSRPVLPFRQSPSAAQDGSAAEKGTG